MEDKVIRIVLAVSDESVRSQVYRVISRFSSLNIVCIVSDGEEAYKRIRRIKPDLVFLEAMMPGMDCVTLIEGLNNTMKEEVPYFLIGYYFLPETLSMIGGFEKVLHCHNFPIKDVVLGKQIEKAIDYYRSITYAHGVRMNSIGGSVLKDNEGYYGEEANLRDDKRIRRIVSNEMKIMGANSKYKGYEYVEQVLRDKLVDSDSYSDGMMKMYEDIGERVGISRYSAEKAIRTVVKNTWINGNHDYFKELWGFKEINERNCPNNSEFLSTVFRSIERDYML